MIENNSEDLMGTSPLFPTQNSPQEVASSFQNQNTEPQQSQKKITTSFLLFAILLILLSVGIAIAYLNPRKLIPVSTNLVKNESFPAMTPADSSVKKNEADWIEYYGDQYSFKYPADWIFENNQYLMNLDLYQYSKTERGSGGLPIDISNIKADFSLFELPEEIDRNISISSQIRELFSDNGCTNVHIQPLAPSLAVEVDACCMEVSNQCVANKTFYVPIGSSMLAVNVFPPQSEHLETLRQVISTVNSNNTKDWLVYKNDDYGFEFKYPQSYIISRKEALPENIISSVNSTELNYARTPGDAVPLVFNVLTSLDKYSIFYDKESEILSREEILIENLNFDLTTYKRFYVEGSYEISDIVIIPAFDPPLYFEFSHITEGCLNPSKAKVDCDQYNKTKIWEYQNIRNQILSTFRFIKNRESGATDDKTSVIFNGKTLHVDDDFYFDPAKYYQSINQGWQNCVGDIKAKLVTIQDESIRIDVLEEQIASNRYSPVDSQSKNGHFIEEGTCIMARPMCLDAVQYYCFEVNEVGGKDEFIYHIKEESTMPKP